jgi:FKBP-type peptidyl-prolyl cis-trans isomerase FklB
VSNQQTMQGTLIAIALFTGVAVAQTVPGVETNQQPATTVNSPKLSQPAITQEKADPTPSNSSETVAPATSQSDASLIQSRKDKISYAFGVNLARDMQRQKNDLNLDLLVKAMTDALAGKPLIMSDEEVIATLKKTEEEQKQDYEHARTMISAKNKKAGEVFFAENAKKDGVVTLPSGLQYKILKKGDGKLPTLEDKIVCQYRGTLLDGTEFDNSEKRGKPATLPVKGILAGWTQALQLMPVGSKWQLFIPSQLAYGEKIVHGIGPNAMLIFDVELLSILDKTQTASAAK